ncbi:unnamed protein product, partial [Amoebophrya sp. A25]|eukprot:GSA25T00004570001.1
MMKSRSPSFSKFVGTGNGKPRGGGRGGILTTSSKGWNIASRSNVRRRKKNAQQNEDLAVHYNQVYQMKIRGEGEANFRGDKLLVIFTSPTQRSGRVSFGDDIHVLSTPMQGICRCCGSRPKRIFEDDHEWNSASSCAAITSRNRNHDQHDVVLNIMSNQATSTQQQQLLRRHRRTKDDLKLRDRNRQGSTTSRKANHDQGKHLRSALRSRVADESSIPIMAARVDPDSSFGRDEIL